MEVPKSLRGKAQLRSEVQAESVSSQVLKLLKSGRVEEEESGPTNKELIQRIKPVEFDNYLPKKQVHVWSEAKGGVSKSRFFPEYGHLLLSSSMDGKLRVYEAQGRRRCLMTYAAHKHAVRDFDWSPQGSHFISCSYDKTVKLWDAETGQVTMTLDNGSLPIVGRFYPLDSNVFLVGQSDKKIVQWDSRAGQTVQVYNRHLGAVNTITWIDDCRRFVTSSDDKSIRVWEYNIPVDIKYIAEPYMHSMPSITLHSNKKWFLCQSLDNQILVYSTKDRFRLNRKKRFAGHLVAGYACNISVSPDGRCVTSGDSHGNLIFWDWKTTKILKKIKAHDHVSIDVQWHPLEPSRLVSSGWDKVVKLWD
ncbi:pre-mRNA-processing factor 17-like [Schistocerca gregaria]|uniref:pre-mRNA-processing factor 17-like n=1 Tax=Schistocerca gregaria TaxID=7010 RepID=UPI00211E7F14|nr:pre-mRNA-processing factor 17-like [Schistocerca gregaria]